MKDTESASAPSAGFLLAAGLEIVCPSITLLGLRISHTLNNKFKLSPEVKQK